MDLFSLFRIAHDAGAAAMLLRGPGLLFHRRLAARIRAQLEAPRD